MMFKIWITTLWAFILVSIWIVGLGMYRWTMTMLNNPKWNGSNRLGFYNVSRWNEIVPSVFGLILYKIKCRPEAEADIDWVQFVGNICGLGWNGLDRFASNVFNLKTNHGFDWYGLGGITSHRIKFWKHLRVVLGWADFYFMLLFFTLL